ncbi:MAG: hypothetical protein ACR2QA_00995 [Solirubrobacteraceae bacterium]
MVLFYFRIATLTPTARPFHVDPTKLVHKTTLALLIVFGLYVVWDLGGIWMAKSSASSQPRYPKIDEDTNKKLEGQRTNVDGLGLSITILAAAVLVGLFFIGDHRAVSGHAAEHIFIAATVILLAYRWLKDARSSYKYVANDLPVVPVVDLTAVDPNAHAVGGVVAVLASGKESRWKRIK